MQKKGEAGKGEAQEARGLARDRRTSWGHGMLRHVVEVGEIRGRIAGTQAISRNKTESA